MVAIFFGLNVLIFANILSDQLFSSGTISYHYFSTVILWNLTFTANNDKIVIYGLLTMYIP